jgi:hypothetical protein
MKLQIRSLLVGGLLFGLCACAAKSGISTAPPPGSSPLVDEAEIRITKPSAAARRQGFELLAVIRAIDREFGGPTYPTIAPREFRVAAVHEDGVVQLEEGESLPLSGVICSTAGIATLSKLLTMPGVTIFYQKDDSVPDESAGNLWMIKRSVVDGQSIEQHALVVENALTSGWCRSVDAGQNGFRQKYEMLEEVGKRFSGREPSTSEK